jgi:ankyrin repeat protein
MDGIMENNYDSIHIPYGRRFNAKNIEKLMFKRDIVFNAEWNPRNVPPQRPYKLHRHPCFFGDMKDIFEDCCGYCAIPDCPEAIALQKEEEERFVKGEIMFMIDDPGRQSVGSFHPITDGDWSEMAYLSNVALLASAIAQNDVAKVEKMLENCDVNKRDPTGKTMLFLAGQCGSTDVAKLLVEKGARLTARNFDGRTILHLACQMGNVDLIDIILKKSKANAEGKEVKEVNMESETEPEDSEGSDGGFEKIKRSEARGEVDECADTEEEDILNLDFTDWDYCFTPLHHAIFSGHLKVVQLLIEEGADVTIPVKIPRPPQNAPYMVKKQTLFPIVLCANTKNGLPIAQLLIRPGVSSQSDSASTTALHMLISAKAFDIVKLLIEKDPKATTVLSHLSKATPPLAPIHSAIFNKDIKMAKFLLEHGAGVSITMSDFIKHAESVNAWWLRSNRDAEKSKVVHYGNDILQPLEMAVGDRNLELSQLLVERGANVNLAPRQFYSNWEWAEYI